MNPATCLLDLPALRTLEQTATEQGLDLMQRAAQAIARWVPQHLPAAQRILVAVGPGNNGADALYAANLLRQAGYTVEVLMPVNGNTQVQAAWAQWHAAGGERLTQMPTETPDLLIDGLFGVGLDRPLQDPWRRLIRQLAGLHCPVLAVDVPSGLHAFTGQPQGIVLPASATLTFLCDKPGLHTAAGRDVCGKVSVDLLDCPAEWYPAAAGTLAVPSASPLWRKQDSHKGSHGVLSIVGGMSGMNGAALLAGRAALAMGAGKVFVHPLDPQLTLDPQCPELMLRPWQAGMQIPPRHQLVIGPGLGLSDTAHEALATLLAHPGQLVLDADALNMLAVDPALQQLLARRQAATILTPHPTEAARLLDCQTDEIQADRPAALAALCQRFDAIVLLKGSGTLVGQGQHPYHLIPHGSPSLAVAGQGDILAGAIAALLAQGMPALEATVLAADIHACAGEHYTRDAGGPIGLSSALTLRYMTADLNRRLRDAGAVSD